MLYPTINLSNFNLSYIRNVNQDNKKRHYLPFFDPCGIYRSRVRRKKKKKKKEKKKKTTKKKRKRRRRRWRRIDWRETTLRGLECVPDAWRIAEVDV